MGSAHLRDISLDDVVYSPPDLPDDFECSVLPVDKPQGWTSFDVIRRLRRILRVRKMGHAGTLDPMATGLLMVLVGPATKLQDRFLELDKEYEAVIRLGEITPSYDAESEVQERHDWSTVSDDDLERTRRAFMGSIIQQAPTYSAVKMGGERLYKKARRGENVVPPKRAVSVYEFTITDRRGADVFFTLRCSKGTYVRSLAHEFGLALEVGAHVVALRRTAIGSYNVRDAWQIPDLDTAAEKVRSTG